MARAGSLRIEGREGLATVRAHGTARASRRAVLEEVQLRVERRGTTIEVRAETPDDLDDGDHASLDLVVELPRAMAVRVTDGSGDAEVRGVRSLEIHDGSGELRIRDVGGPVRVNDGSGAVIIDQVRGDLTIDDGSGSLEAADVTGSFRVVSKGSGSVEASRIGGDFIVEHRSSGSVDYRDVKGRVDVPERRRRHRN